jgi:quercetin dioxygenase-like cupin family protein
MVKQKFIKTSIDTMPGYMPAGHKGTVNHILIGPDMGSKHAEIIVGEMKAGGGSERHVHVGSDQFVYMLSGHHKVITDCLEGIQGPGELVMFPAGVYHDNVSLDDSKFLVIYAPPLGK